MVHVWPTCTWLLERQQSKVLREQTLEPDGLKFNPGSTNYLLLSVTLGKIYNYLVSMFSSVKEKEWYLSYCDYYEDSMR